MGAFVYIVRCRDGSYYTGSTRSTLEHRLAEHNAGTFDGYTSQRRPVELVYSQYFEMITDAIAAERQIKGWSRAKKAALMRGDFASLTLWRAAEAERLRGVSVEEIFDHSLRDEYALCGSLSSSVDHPHPSRRSGRAAGALTARRPRPQDEDDRGGVRGTTASGAPVRRHEQAT